MQPPAAPRQPAVTRLPGATRRPAATRFPAATRRRTALGPRAIGLLACRCAEGAGPRRATLLTLALLLTLASPGQQQQTVPVIQDTGTKFTTDANLVIVDVTVKDPKTGQPIEGLKASDFTLLEDNKPQKISTFEFQKLAVEPEPPEPPPSLEDQRALARRSQDHHHRAIAQPDSVSRQTAHRPLLRFLKHGHPRATSRPGCRAALHQHSDDRERPDGHPDLHYRRAGQDRFHRQSRSTHRHRQGVSHRR